jgi:hypothetical protein
MKNLTIVKNNLINELIDSLESNDLTVSIKQELIENDAGDNQKSLINLMLRLCATMPNKFESRFIDSNSVQWEMFNMLIKITPPSMYYNIGDHQIKKYIFDSFDFQFVHAVHISKIDIDFEYKYAFIISS